MRVQVACFASLSGFTPPDGRMELDAGSTPRDIIHTLGISEKDVKIVFVNGQNAHPDTRLSDNDRVGLFPAIGGG